MLNLLVGKHIKKINLQIIWAFIRKYCADTSGNMDEKPLDGDLNACISDINPVHCYGTLIDPGSGSATAVISTETTGIAEPNMHIQAHKVLRSEDANAASRNERYRIQAMSYSERYMHDVDSGRLAPSAPYDVRPSTKTAATLKWEASLKLAEVVHMSGKFWSKFGFSINRRDFLYPEEALYLAERGTVLVIAASAMEVAASGGPPSSTLAAARPAEEQDAVALSSDSMKVPIAHTTLRDFYATVTECVPVPLYLAYVKLKDLDYVVTRFRKAVHLIENYSDLDDYMRSKTTGDCSLSRSISSSTPLLDRSASFSVYLPDTWSKKAAAAKTPPSNALPAHVSNKPKQKHSPPTILPVAHVIVTTAFTIPPTPVLLELLREAASTPIIFAVVTRSGHVSLTEMSDALLCLDWTSGFRRGAAQNKPINKTPVGDNDKKRKATEAIDASAV